MANIIENLFSYIDVSFNLLPISFFFLFQRDVGRVTGLRIIMLYAISNIIINVLLLLTSRSNFLLYDSQTLVEYILFSWFIHSQLNKEKPKAILIAFGFAYVIFFFTYFLLKSTKGFDSVPIGVEAIILFGFAFYYLYERMNDTTTLFIYNTYQFWIILGIVLYLAGTFFIYIFADYLRNSDQKMVDRLWPVTNIFSIIKSILFSVSIIVHAKPSKETLQYHLDVSRLN